MFTRIKAAALAITIVSAAGGCLAAAGAGLGAGIYLSDRGAESLVSTGVEQTFTAAQQVFREMNIVEQKSTSEETSTSQERQLNGKLGDTNVMVSLKTEGSATRVEVVASEDMVKWDKDLAKDILGRIVKATQS